MAWANTGRSDGSRSRKRVRIEAQRAASLLAEIVLVPVLAATILAGSIFMVDRYVIPMPLLRDVISLFDLRFSVWDENMETGEFGDVGITYGEWAASRGYSFGAGRTIRKFIKNNWLALVLISVVVSLLAYWFVMQYYLASIRAYKLELMRRREQYRLVDVVRTVEQIQ